MSSNSCVRHPRCVVAVALLCITMSSIVPSLAAPTPDLLSFAEAFDFTWNVYSITSNFTNATFYKVAAPNTTIPSDYSLNNTATVAAQVIFNASLYDQGWDYLQVSPAAPGDLNNYYVGGFGEGYVTHQRIDLVYNSQGPFNLTPAAETWFQEHLMYMQTQSQLQNSSFWVQVGNLFALMQGIADGYSARAAELGSRTLSMTDIFRLNFAVEAPDVETATGGGDGSSMLRRRRKQKQPSSDKSSSQNIFPDQHCSALVAVTPNDIFFSHDTWDAYIGTIRMYKTYTMPEASISYSGMAGMISSGDDWYITSNNLAVQETTNDVFNSTLYELYTVPHTVSEFLRVMTATYLATSAPEWVQLFQYNNSGTYCNQWMVLDYNLYEAGTMGASLPDNLLWVAEQIPGNVTSADVTDHLRNDGFWSSYNTPYFTNIFDLSGYPALVEEFGPFFSYANTSRAEIFRRNYTNVTDLPSMQALMRYNNWQNDPLSTIPDCTVCDPARSPMLAIASRGDLVPTNVKLPNNSYADYFSISAFGAVDCKITSSAMISNLQGVIINGPTTYNNQPIFSWSTMFAGQQPVGAPNSYNFSWQYYNIIQPPPPPHGWYAGLSSTDKVVASVAGAVGGLMLILAGVVLYQRKTRHASKDGVHYHALT